MKTRSTSEISRKLTNKLILIVITALLLPMSAAFGATTKWTGATGIWFIGTNWDNGEPDLTTAAQINNGGTAQILTDTPQAVALSLTLGLNADDSGTVEVSPPHGGLTVDQGIFVGYRGKGNLTINDGDSVMSATASIASLANQLLPPSQGSATLVGGGLWTVSGRFDVGGCNNTMGGVALLSVTNGSTVSAGSVRVYNSGTLTGNGTVTTTNGATVEGTLTPSAGTLNIVGDLTFSGTVATMECHVTPASADQVNVSGVASLAGKLSVTMTGTTFTAGSTYTLLHAEGGFDPNHPQFQAVSIKGGSGACFTPVITYDTNNNNVNLYLSPCSN
jgi:T5SS/PEP-CTERM-associated repeat protein